MATTDPQGRWRLIRVSTDLLSQFGTRTERGERITAEWGEPDAEGVYEPTFTVHADDRLCAEPVAVAIQAIEDQRACAGLQAEISATLADALESRLGPVIYEPWFIDGLRV